MQVLLELCQCGVMVFSGMEMCPLSEFTNFFCEDIIWNVVREILDQSMVWTYLSEVDA